MGYLHITNLYRDQRILLFKECFALEKVHGTSAHLAWRDGQVNFFSGGEKHERFVSLFNQEVLTAGFAALGHSDITVYGEAYGGSQQGQSWRYGKMLKFVAFDVKIGDSWLSVPQAVEIVAGLGLEFVYFEKISTDLASIDAQRDAPTTQGKRNGVEGDHPREGVVLRPLVEMSLNNGERLIVKHKRDEERETNKPRKVVDPAQLEVLTKANDIAVEWVTPTRLEHVLDKLGQDIGMERTGDVIKAMVADVEREAAGEIVMSKEARTAIGTLTVKLFKEKLRKVLVEG